MTPSKPSKSILPFHLLRALVAVLLLVLSSVPAAGATSEFRILLNVDVNPTTGCDVTTVDGVFPGVEQILVTTVETQASTGQVTLVERQECIDEVTDTFGPLIPVSAGGWPVGAGLGLDGSDVIETFVGLADVGGANPPPVIRLGVVGDDGSAEDALLVVRPAGNQPILFNLASILEIPTLSEWGLILLALLLAALAFWHMRRLHRRGMAALLLLVCLGVTAVAWASIRDGLIDDWLGIAPLAEDPQADAPLGADLRALFAMQSGGEICFRLDAFLEFNGPPDAVDDDFMVMEDSVGNSLDVLSNDDDPEMDPLTITAVGTPDQGGMATTDGSTITYTPAADFKGVETFTYVLDDGNGNMDTATVTVTVTNVNDDPDAVDDSFMVTEDSSSNSLDVLANDTDAPDMGETLTITGVGMPDQGGSASIVGGGTSLSYTPAADFAGAETFTYTIDDGNGGMDTATVTVTVTNENDPPDAVDDMLTVDEDSIDNPLDVLANDTDAPDSGETLTITGVGTPSQGGTATTDGSTVTYSPPSNFVGMETFTYTISDGNGGMDTATVTVTVQDANPDPPVCGADTAMTDEDNSTLVDVLANDTDPDPGQTATLMVSAVDTMGTTGMVTNNGTDVTYDPNGQFESLDDGEMAMDSFSYTAQDSTGLTCMATVTVTITGVNDAPMVVGEIFDVAAGNFPPAIGNTTLQFANADAVATPDVFVMGDVLDNDSDPENDGLAITGFQNPSTQGGTVSLNLATGEFTYLPPVGFEGVDSFTYTVSDGTDTAMGTVSVEVADMVWYIDNDPANDGSGDDGRSSSSFDSIAQFEAENGVGAADDPEAGDVIFVFQGTSTYDAGGGDPDGLDLLDQQKLLGEGVDLIVQGLTLVSGNPANQPSIDNTNMGGDAVTVLADTADRTGVEIRGLSITGDDNAVEVTSANTFQVGVTISDNTIAGSGAEGLHFNPGSSGAFVTTVENNVFSTSSAVGNAIDVTTAAASGDVEIAFNANTDVTSSGGAGIVLDNSAGGGDLFITGFAGNTVHGNTVGDGIRILNATFDADPADADFTGDEVSGGDTTVGVGNPVGGSAMVLTNVAGDLAFGALTLSTDGMGSVGLDVTGNGTLNAGAGTGFEITNTGGTINSVNGPAVDLDPLTAGLTFSSVSSGSSGVHGIRLHDVAGSFTATGGALANSIGSAIRVTGTNPGDSTVAVSLSNMTVNHTAGLTPVIFGQNSNGLFSLTGSTVNKGGGRVLDFDDMDGGSDFTGTTINSTNHHGKRIIDSSGVHNLPNLQIATAPPAGVDALHLVNNPGATFNVPRLEVTTNGSRGIFANNGGTLNVTGGTNQITTTGHSAVEMSNTTVGASGVTFASLSATSTGANEGIDLDGVGGGTFNVTGTTTVNGTGAGQSALDVATSGATFTFNSIDVDNPGGAGVALTNNTGPVTISGGDVSGAAGTAFDVNGGSHDVTYAGTLNNTTGKAVEITGRATAGRTITLSNAITHDNGAGGGANVIGIDINGNSAGTTLLSGASKVVNSGTQDAVTLTNNMGHLIQFTNGGLDIDATSGDGFTATGGGTVEVTGAVNTIDNTTGSALNVANTTIGAGRLIFQRISSNGGSNPGIVLNTTGTAGGLTVTGTGGDCKANVAQCSGGSIVNKTGDVDGILLTTTVNLDLSHMNVSGHSRNGIFGTGVNGFRLNQSRFTGNADQASPDEAAVHFVDSTGSILGGANQTRFDDLLVSNSHEHNVIIRNNSGTITNLAVDNSTFTNNGASTEAGNNFFIDAGGTANVTVNMTGSQFNGNTTPGTLTAFGLVGDAADTSSVTLNASTGSFSSNNVALSASASNSGNVTFDFSNHPTVTGSRSNAINVFANANHTGTISGRIENNTVGTNGVLSSGSQFGSGVRIANEGTGTVTALINGNTIQEVGDGNINAFEGIFVNETVNGGTTNVTITGNTLDQIRDDRGINVQQVNGGGTVCSDISGNTLTNIGSATPLRVRQVTGTHDVRQLDPAGPADPNRLDTANGGVSVSVSGTINFNAGACPQP